MHLSKNAAIFLTFIIFSCIIIFYSEVSVFAGGSVPVLNESLEVTNKNGNHDDLFGSSTAIDGEFAAFGAHFQENPDPGFAGSPVERSGSVFVYSKSESKKENLGDSGWVFQQQLLPQEYNTDERFGFDVDIDGSVMVIGAPGDTETSSPFTGAVYVFIYDGNEWIESDKILPDDSNGNAWFGSSVAIDGDTLIVGAFEDDSEETDGGSAYVFVRSGGVWTQQAKLMPVDLGEGDNFGVDVDLEDTRAVVGSWKNDHASVDNGAVYFFRRNGTTWNQEQKLISDNPADEDEFGISISLSGDRLAVGARNDDEANNNAGAVFIFKSDGISWSQEDKITVELSSSFDWFGVSVDLEQNNLVVGSEGKDLSAVNEGTAFVFKRNGASWDNLFQLVASNGSFNARLGQSVALSGTDIVAGAPQKTVAPPKLLGNSNQGAGYFFKIPQDVSKPIFDFDGDSKTDISIFRPSVGEWWYLRSSDGGNNAFQFGSSTDKLVPADYTGDGKTDIAFWRENTGEWFVLRSEDSSFYSFPFGTNGDIPAPGDYDGDGIADAAVFRPADTTWFINRSSDGGTTIEGFGATEDKPVVADYDGDGKDDIAIFRPSVSEWWINRSTDGVIVFQFGSTGDITVPGDYTVDGKADVAFFRPNTGEWFVIRSEDQSFFAFPFGTGTDVPAPGDYDGDGQFDAAVFRDSNTTWFINGSTSGTQIVGFGANGDVPVPSVYSVP